MSAHEQAKHREGHTPGLSYLPGLDGLRAIAVLAVIFYHNNYTSLPGGFLGVDVFFVISGYLITSLLLQEWERSQTINLPQFWLRRARRLLPAVFFLIIAVLTFSVIFLPDEVASLRTDAAAAMAYVTNWYFILSHKSYFEAIGRPPMLQHLWSLAIEEQFYIIWPVVLLFMLRRLQPRRILLIVIGGIVASTLLMAVLYQPNHDPSRVYYGTDTRAAGLLFGVALAFVWKPGRVTHRFDKLPVDLAGIAALGLLIVFFFRLNQFEPALFRGGFALVSLTTAVLIAVTVHPLARFGSVIGRQPFRWMGQRSYGIYLWHWPIFMLTRPMLDVALTGLPLLALRLALTFAIAELSYRIIEMPIRQGALGKAWHTLRQTRGPQRWALAIRWAATVGALVIFSMMLGAAVVQAQPPPPPAYLSAEVVNAANATSTPVPAAVPGSDTAAMRPILIPGLPDATKTASPTPVPLRTVVAPSPTATTASGLSPAEVQAVRTPDIVMARNVSTASEPTPTATFTPVPPTATPAPAPTDTPVPTPAPTCMATGGHVMAIGDSVMIGAGPYLHDAICDIEIDAVLGRQVWDVADLIKAKRAAGMLGQVAILHIGDNGVFTSGMFDDIMNALTGVRRVVFVTVKVPRSGRARTTPSLPMASGAIRILSSSTGMLPASGGRRSLDRRHAPAP